MIFLSRLICQHVHVAVPHLDKNKADYEIGKHRHFSSFSIGKTGKKIKIFVIGRRKKFVMLAKIFILGTIFTVNYLLHKDFKLVLIREISLHYKNRLEINLYIIIIIIIIINMSIRIDHLRLPSRHGTFRNVESTLI